MGNTGRNPVSAFVRNVGRLKVSSPVTFIDAGALPILHTNTLDAVNFFTLSIAFAFFLPSFSINRNDRVTTDRGKRVCRPRHPDIRSGYNWRLLCMKAGKNQTPRA